MCKDEAEAERATKLMTAALPPITSSLALDRNELSERCERALMEVLALDI